MNKILKYGIFPIVIFIFLLVVTVMLMPVLINVQRYVPEIEKSISEASGRPFSIGSDVAVSFFPWLSLTFSDLKLGNPPGFVSDALVKIDSFEARIKLLPLLKKEIRISRFVVGGLEVNLEKNSDGKDNWEMLRSMALPRLDFLQDSIFCTLLAVTDGKVNWIDRTNHVRHSVEDLMLLLNNVQADRHIALDFKASYDGRPIALEGRIGPFGHKQGDESFPLDIGFHLMETLQGQVQGKVENWGTAPVYDVALNLSSFSPRKLFAALAVPFPVDAADPATFQAVGLELAVKGRRDGLTVEKGTARLDDTTIVFSGEVKDMKKPDVDFSLNIDRLDLDRYFLPGNREEVESAKVKHENSAMGMIHRLAGTAAFAGSMNVQSLKMYGATGSAVKATIGGKEGILTLINASMQLYGGQLQANLTADLSGEMPRMRVGVQVQGVEAETMMREMAGRDILTGTLAGDMTIEFSGNLSAARQKSLSGEASFACLDGALLGVDLARSIERRALVEAGPADERKSLRTDFSELKGVVTIEGGLLTIREATLTSPAVAMAVGGGANIPGRTWNLQVAPQGEVAKQAKGKPSLPLTITGTFDKPDSQVDNRRQLAVGTAAGTAKGNVASLVDGKIPSPIDDDVKDLVGKALIDPAIVAQRFHLQRETIRQSEKKKQLQLGSGKIRINPLLEETTL
ncbi:MAG: hypothetical protein A2X81_09075 [Desulfobacterales bacterium GWB2_56_26]|nr:MAG: hypothetical protein A2X81_09075 [Desulfobacterales bacterium GWB2_56_26]